MKTNITLLIAVLFLGLNTSFAQEQNECLTKLSIMSEYAKAKDYEAAYKPFMELREECPKYNKAIYTYGEKILNHKIKQSEGPAKITFINDLLRMWEERAVNFKSKTPVGEYGAKACQLKYDNRIELRMSDGELYQCFDTAFKADRATFKNPKSIYIYFKLMVSLFDSGEKTAQNLFDKYDDVVEKIEDEVSKSSKKLNELIAKEDAGTALTSKELRWKKYYSQVLKAFAKISGSVDAELGERANCANLIPLYQADFENNKSNGIWLKRAVSKMYHKGCTEDPLYEKLVKAYDETAPSADTKYFVATLLFKKGKDNEATKYLKESLELESDPYKKAKRANTIGLIYKKKGSYGQARTYFTQSLKLNPSNGRPHLSIAAMYKSSAKNCGDSNFNKRAVFWLAANEALKAGRVDPTLKKTAAQTATSYRASAPSKSEIHSAGKSGATIKVACWIGRSVKVPTI